LTENASGPDHPPGSPAPFGILGMLMAAGTLWHQAQLADWTIVSHEPIVAGRGVAAVAPKPDAHVD